MDVIRVENELAKIQALLIGNEISERQYEQLYAAQQALSLIHI